MDDTNPTKEDVEYVESIQNDVAWLISAWADDKLGLKPKGKTPEPRGNDFYLPPVVGKSHRDPSLEPFYASDYFDQIYEFALQLIRKGKAYVDDLSAEDTDKCKPDPEGYRLALAALRASRARDRSGGRHPGRPSAGLGTPVELTATDCLVIEDSLAGIASANEFSRVPESHRGAGREIRRADPGAWSSHMSREEILEMHEILAEKLDELGYLRPGDIPAKRAA